MLKLRQAFKLFPKKKNRFLIFPRLTIYKKRRQRLQKYRTQFLLAQSTKKKPK